MKTFLAKCFDTPSIYKVFGYLVGTASVKRVLDEHLDLGRRSRVLDFGCGLGKFATGFCGEFYLGIDPLEACIDEAKKMFAAEKNINFMVGDHLTLREFAESSFDFVFALGVLHHMKDEEIMAFEKELERILTPGGEVVFWDPVLYDSQPWLTRRVIELDRGQMARTKEGYLEFFPTSEYKSSCQIYTRLLRIPYDHIAISLKKVRYQSV